MTDSISPDDRSQLAAEYVLRLLEGDELRQARALVGNDADFQAEVASWNGRLAPLLDEVEPVAPSRGLLSAIERRIAGSAGPASNVHQLRRRIVRWQGLAAAASAIAATLAFLLVARPDPIAPIPAEPVAASAPLVAVVASEDGTSRLVATWNSAAESLVVVAATGAEAQPGRSYELWVIPADGTPRSAGLLRDGAPTHLKVQGPVAGFISEGVTLAVSVEPAGGSPTGGPTGPVIATGKLQQT